jgi:signal transduction histidine kinase
MRGLALRVSLITSGAIVVVVLIALAVFYVERQHDVVRGFRPPLPHQVAAIVALIETTPAQDLPRVLEALNSSVLRVTVQDRQPEPGGPVTAPGLTRLLQHYFSTFVGRPVEALLGLAGDDTAPAPSSRSVRLVIGVRDGRYVVIEPQGELLRQFTGIRLALVALSVSIVISGLSLWALKRQIRPLERLARTVEAFDVRLESLPLEPREGVREVRQLVAAITRMQARIRELVDGRTRMLAAISHDLRTYLTRLQLRAQFIADTEQRERAVRDIEDMDSLMTDLLTLTKGEHERDPLERVDLVALLRRHAEGFAAGGAIVPVHAPTDALEVEVHPVSIGRALNNLIANALKHGPEAVLTVEGDGDVAVILVEDRGPGIPADERAAVLEPFYRRDRARNLDEAGFGLGLAIVADVVARHAGTIALEDREGGGLRVRIRIPRQATPSTADTRYSGHGRRRAFRHRAEATRTETPS